MSAPRKPELTGHQRYLIEQAREALAASKADKSMEEYARHLGALEYRLETALQIIDELTGGAS